MMPFLPDVILLGAIPLPFGAVTGLLGLLLAYLLIGRQKSEASQVEAGRELVLHLMIGGILTAKLIYVLRDPLSYVENPAALLIFPYGPIALPAGALGGLSLAVWGLRTRPDRLTVLDQAAVPLLTGLALAATGLTGPGLWAFAPLLLIAALLTWALTRRQSGLAPGSQFAVSVIMAAAALVAADLARPTPGLAGGITGLQLTAALVGTGAWAWIQRTPGT